MLLCTISANILTQIVSQARPEDAFALITARGESRDVLLNALHDLTAKGEAQDSGVRDAVQQGVAWLQPRQKGDAILLHTMGIESYSRTNFRKVRDALEPWGIRLFGMQFGPIVAGYVSRMTVLPHPDCAGISLFPVFS